MKKTIEACIIAKNESEIIENCLQSLRGIDSIVVVDTGSSDNTIEISKKYTSKVYSYSGCNDENGLLKDFSDARNYAISKCTKDFLLIIDCDEQLITPIDRIKTTINEYWYWGYEGMLFEVQTKAETFESPRVFGNRKEIYYINPVHNLPSWNGSTSELQAKLYRSAFRIESGYSPAHNLDPDRTLRILLKELSKTPNDTRTMYYLAKEYMNQQDVSKATETLEKYRALKYFDCSKWDNELAHALYLLALLYIDEIEHGKSKWFESLQTAMESFNVLPSSSQTAQLISELLGEMPGSTKEIVRRQQMAHEFWKIISKNANNSGVLMQMNYQ